MSPFVLLMGSPHPSLLPQEKEENAGEKHF